MMIKMMKRFFGVCLGGLGVLWTPFGAVFGHFEAPPGAFQHEAKSRSHSTSPFFEDVSGETLIFSIRRLKRRPPRSRFCEDVSSETLLFRTFLDMNGKRMRSKNRARTQDKINIKRDAGVLPECPQGTTMDTRSPIAHKGQLRRFPNTVSAVSKSAPARRRKALRSTPPLFEAVCTESLIVKIRQIPEFPRYLRVLRKTVARAVF